MRAALAEPAPWRVVLAFDRLLAEPLAFRNAAAHLAAAAEALTGLGPVEIVVIDESVRSALPPTRDPRVLAEALEWLRLREVVEDPRGALREVLAADLASAGAGEARTALARRALADESTLVRTAHDALLRWAAGAERAEAKLLVLATGDLGAPATLLELAGDPEAAAVSGATAAETGAALSALGWTVFPFTPAETAGALASGEGSPPPASEAAVEELEEEAEEVVAGSETGGGEAVLFDADRLREALRRRRRGEGEAPAADGALAALAAAAGGRVLLEAADLAPALAELATWRPALWSQAAGPHRVEHELAAAGSARWVGSGSPAPLAAARARGGFGPELDEGDIELGALARRSGEEASLEIEVAAGSWVGAPPATLRLTVALERPDGSIQVEQSEVAPTPGGAWRWSVPLAVAPDDQPPIIVLVDSPETADWGATFAGWLGSAAPERTAADLDALFLPAPRPLHLLAPGQPLLVGVVTFQTVISDPAVARVEFFLDGQRRAVSRALPFTAELDLGPLPRVHRVEAAAFDAGGRELARDALLVNGGSGAFLVTLRTPGRERTAGGVVTARDRLPVEAEVLAPAGRPVARVEVYWGERQVGMRTAAPFRKTIDIPPDAPQGFVRAVAYLVDGAAAEDVVFVNTPGAAESVQVTLVQLYVVVTGEDGRPVPGLARGAFRVEEEGVPRQIASFSDASDLPLTVGLAIDTSASMFVKLPDVRAAAAGFLREVIEPDDRAFVVGFGGEPRLARGTTGDLERLTAGVEALWPAGQTAIWKAIVYSLVQLQGVPGMKALVVYSDGADEDPDFSHKTALRFARLVGVPIHVILTNNEIVRTEGRGLQVRPFIGRLQALVDQVGGRVHLTRLGEDLRGVYGAIARELRSQYVLGYYADRTAVGEWRQVAVEVTEPGLTARAPSGYWH